jgi:hypothetical protein
MSPAEGAQVEADFARAAWNGPDAALKSDIAADRDAESPLEPVVHPSGLPVTGG